jgi:GNAT superfamily N-acetyltransferase
MSGILHPLIGRVIGAVGSGWLLVELREFGPDDQAAIDAFVDLENSCLPDAPWSRPSTAYRQRMMMTHGWDGEVGRYFLAYPDGSDSPVGFASVYTTDYDNPDLAWLGVTVHPEHRRRGHGKAILEQAYDECRSMGRTLVGSDGWDHERTHRFAAATGFEQKSIAVQRRQYLHELEPGLAERLYAEAEPYAADYRLERIDGASPEELLGDIAEATAAINDAPLDDLEIEDEVFSPERVRAYERAQIDSGFRFRRIIARHRGTGEIGGLTVATVDSQTPSLGNQHDTSVVRAHRGHRLGLLLKADMMRWLADAEPELEQLDTWNMESNTHMIAVNERLGYRVMGREMQFQRRL